MNYVPIFPNLGNDKSALEVIYEICCHHIRGLLLLSPEINFTTYSILNEVTLLDFRPVHLLRYDLNLLNICIFS